MWPAASLMFRLIERVIFIRSVRINVRYSSSLNSRNPIGLDIATPTVEVAEEGHRILGRCFKRTAKIDLRLSHDRIRGIVCFLKT